MKAVGWWLLRRIVGEIFAIALLNGLFFPTSSASLAESSAHPKKLQNFPLSNHPRVSL